MAFLTSGLVVKGGGCGKIAVSERRLVGGKPQWKAGRRAVVRCSEAAAKSAGAVPVQTGVYSTAGMKVEEFFRDSIGSWRSMRSSHNLAMSFMEEVNSEIEIENVELDDEAVLAICKQYETDPATAATAIKMSWEGTSDWDEDEVLEGSTLLVLVKDEEAKGRLLRSEGYAETVPAVGEWTMEADGTFVLITPYERASAEERIWFTTPNMRVRVSFIRTQTGEGVLTASMSTEIREL
ncbi:hypothetical protein NDN08_007547 [Rhodosorus marinus]|uniref:Uncharacterized protein n=1 Tax=Rhodosorus marinus TaxID=101924 RepID=A0AAV8V3J8_9RHOD|nr:hypothetical protein NDN08_007547 [Rhodosorus marinus]